MPDTDRLVLGIDLGTTYSCVALLDPTSGRPEVLPNSDGEYTTPSVVWYSPEGDVVVGKMAKNEIANHPDRVVQLIKRHMGEEGFSVPVGDKDLLPQQVSAVILRYVVEDALTETGRDIPTDGPLADVVITVPAYFSMAQRSVTRDAGVMAGLNVIGIINEPTAAAIAYGVALPEEERTVLVFDLGGGTFDVTVIKVSPGEIRVVATGGDAKLGGANWDEELLDLVAEEFSAQAPTAGDPRTDEEAGSLSLQIEDAKKNLSKKETYALSVSAHGARARIELSRTALDEVTRGLVDRTLDYTRYVWEAARAKGVTRLDDLILVGGMTKLPVFKERLRETFPDFPEARRQDPDQIVAKGAALFAAAKVVERADEERAGTDDERAEREPGRLPGDAPTIVNVSSKGYGIEVHSRPQDAGYIDWLIAPNDELPATPREIYHTMHDNQTSVTVNVFESRREPDAEQQLSSDLADHRLIVTGDITGIPRHPKGQPIEVSYELDDEGILRITALCHGKILHLSQKVSGATPLSVMAEPLPLITR